MRFCFRQPDFSDSLNLNLCALNSNRLFFFFFKQTIKIVMNCCRLLLHVAVRIAHKYGFRGYFGIMDTLFALTISVLGIYSKEIIMDVDKIYGSVEFSLWHIG